MKGKKANKSGMYVENSQCERKRNSAIQEEIWRRVNNRKSVCVLYAGPEHENKFQLQCL